MTPSHPVLRGLGGRIVLGLGLVVLVIVAGQVGVRLALEQRVVDLDMLSGAMAHRALGREITADASRLREALGEPGEHTRVEQLFELLRDFDRGQQDLRQAIEVGRDAHAGMGPLLLALEPRFRALHRAGQAIVAVSDAGRPLPTSEPSGEAWRSEALPTDEEVREAGAQFIRMMDRIVAQARWEVWWNVSRLYGLQLWVLGAMVLTLVSVAMLLIRPAFLAVARAFGEFAGQAADAAGKRAELEQQLADTAARLDEATQVAASQTSFLSHLSRDLRRRLASLPASTALAGESELSPTQRLYAASLQSLVDRLERLTRDVLDLTEIEVGALALNQAPFSLRETIASALAVAAPDAALRGFELRCEVEPDVPDSLVGDGVRLKQIVGVLVGLSVEQTLDGAVTTHVRAERPGEGGIVVVVEIRSDSAPLPREAQTLLASGGSGRSVRLGLGALARLAHMLGDGIHYEGNARPSVLRLSVRLEVADAPEVTAPPPGASVEETAQPAGEAVHALPPGRLQVLLVDDEELTRSVTVAMLKRQGYCVVEAGDGDAALAALEEEEFDFVLMDVDMPKLDGYQTTAAIRERERPWGRRLPIVALTAGALEGERERCLAAGMDGHLPKPVRLQDLRTAVGGLHLGKPAVVPGDPAGPLDAERVLAQAGGADVALELARTFAEQTRRTLGAIRDGVAANEADRVTRGAIRMRGTLAGLGAWAGYETARGLEAIGRKAMMGEAGAVLSALEAQVEETRVALEALAAGPSVATPGEPEPPRMAGSGAPVAG